MYDFLEGKDKKKFDNKYKKLKLENRVREATVEEANEFYSKRYDLLFEAQLNSEYCKQIGVIVVGLDKYFVIGVSFDGEIIIFDKLSNFLKI